MRGKNVRPWQTGKRSQGPPAQRREEYKKVDLPLPSNFIEQRKLVNAGTRLPNGNFCRLPSTPAAGGRSPRSLTGQSASDTGQRRAGDPEIGSDLLQLRMLEDLRVRLQQLTVALFGRSVDHAERAFLVGDKFLDKHHPA